MSFKAFSTLEPALNKGRVTGPHPQSGKKNENKRAILTLLSRSVRKFQPLALTDCLFVASIIKQANQVTVSVSHSVTVSSFVTLIFSQSFSLSVTLSIIFSVSQLVCQSVKSTRLQAFGLVFIECFLGATKHLYKRVCPSFRPSVGRSVRPSVRP